MSKATAIVSTLACLLAGDVTPAAAQMGGGDPDAHREAMQRPSFLVGAWEGDGWIAGREGRRQVRHSEIVRYELDGTIMLVEGTTRELIDGELGEVIFNAFAVVSWSRDGGYTMRSYLWNGLEGESALEVGEGELSWRQQTPAGTMVYAMRLTEGGEWHETGTLTRADGQEVPVVEFRLSRATR